MMIKEYKLKKGCLQVESYDQERTEEAVVAPGSIEPFFAPVAPRTLFWKDFMSFKKPLYPNQTQSVRTRSIPSSRGSVLDCYLVVSSVVFPETFELESINGRKTTKSWIKWTLSVKRSAKSQNHGSKAGKKHQISSIQPLRVSSRFVWFDLGGFWGSLFSLCRGFVVSWLWAPWNWWAT